MTYCPLWLPCASASKESACNMGDLGSISGLGRSPGEGNSYPLQFSGLENSMDCIVHGVTESRTRREWLSLSLLSFWDNWFIQFLDIFLTVSMSIFRGNKVKVKVARLCPTLCDPMDCKSSGSFVHGILQATILEWVTISFSRGSFQPRNWTQFLCIAGRFFTVWAKCWPIIFLF